MCTRGKKARAATSNGDGHDLTKYVVITAPSLPSPASASYISHDQMLSFCTCLSLIALVLFCSLLIALALSPSLSLLTSLPVALALPVQRNLCEEGAGVRDRKVSEVETSRRETSSGKSELRREARGTEIGRSVLRREDKNHRRRKLVVFAGSKE
jgi:hypothetical protein